MERFLLLNFLNQFICYDRANEGEGGSDGGADDGGADGGNDNSGANEGGGQTAQQIAQNTGSLLDGTGKAGDEANDGKDVTNPGNKMGEGRRYETRPEWAPQKFYDAEKGDVNVENLANAYTKLEKAHTELRSQKGLANDAPKEATEYFADFTTPEDANRVGDVSKDDPALQVFSEVLHKHGIGKEMASAMVSEFLTKINPHLPEPINTEAEIEKLGPNGKALIGINDAWLTGMFQSGQLSSQELAVAYTLATNAEGIQLLNKFRVMSGEMPTPRNGDPMGENGLPSVDGYYDMLQSDEYENDESYRNKVDAIGEKLEALGLLDNIAGKGIR